MRTFPDVGEITMLLELITGLMYVAAGLLLLHQPRIFVTRAAHGRGTMFLCAALILVGINVPCDFHELLWDRAHDHPEALLLRSFIESELQLVVVLLVGAGGALWWCITSAWRMRLWVQLGIGAALAVELGRAGLLVSGDAPLVAAALTGLELAGLTVAVFGGPWRHRACSVPI